MGNCYKSSVACALYEGHPGPCQSFSHIDATPFPSGPLMDPPDPRDAEIEKLRSLVAKLAAVVRAAEAVDLTNGEDMALVDTMHDFIAALTPAERAAAGLEDA